MHGNGQLQGHGNVQESGKIEQRFPDIMVDQGSF